MTPHGPARAVAIGVLVPLLAAGCMVTRAMEAADLIGDIAAAADAASAERGEALPSRTLVTYRVDGRRRSGDLYRPSGGARAMVVLVPGVARAGKDDPRLVGFARVLARARFRVLVPDIAGLRALKVNSSDARDIADAVRHLSAGAGERPAAGVGIIAISYAAGPAVLAALEEDVRKHVAFVLTVGGYYDLESVITFSITGRYRAPSGGPWLRARPNAYGKWVFVQGNADRLSDPLDRAALAEMAARKLRNPNAAVDDLVARLGAEGRSLHALLVNDSPERVPGLIARLPAAVRSEVAALSLRTHDLSKLQARLIVIHGRDDAIIPSSESVALAAAAPKGQADLYLVDSLSHVDMRLRGLGDSFRLWRAAYRLLAERDAMIASH